MMRHGFSGSAATIVAIKMKNDLDLPKSYGGLEGHLSVHNTTL